MEVFDTVSTEIQQFVHGGSPSTYFNVGLIAAAYWLLCEIGHPRVVGFFSRFVWLSWIVLAASVVGFVWGSVPAEFLVAVPVAIWVQGNENQREYTRRELERLRANAPTGAIDPPPYTPRYFG